MALLEETERIGLVHCVSNVIEGVFYICNCCGCCCGILRGITEYGIAESVARANYFAVVDDEICTQCGTCIERCQVQAIADDGEKVTIDRVRCIGCGLCVSGCPADAARLEKLPEAEMVHPPEDFDAWEAARQSNRGQKAH